MSTLLFLNKFLDVFGKSRVLFHVAALLAGDVSGLTSVEVVLTGFTAEHLTRLGNLIALGDGFVGLHKVTVRRP